MPTYYVSWVTGTKQPNGVYRFYDEAEDRDAEFYRSDSGWVPDNTLYYLLMTGEIDKTNIITESEALNIVRILDASKGKLSKT